MFNIDIVKNFTISSISFAIYRRNYLKDYQEIEITKQITRPPPPPRPVVPVAVSNDAVIEDEISIDSELNFDDLEEFAIPDAPAPVVEEEEQVLKDYQHIDWGVFNLENLFGGATRGRRLKSADRIIGTLPFVTAGERDEGISAFHG